MSTVIKAEEEEPKKQNYTDVEDKVEDKGGKGVKAKMEEDKDQNTHSATKGKKGKKFDSNDNIDINALSFSQRAKQLQFYHQFSKFFEVFLRNCT